MPHVAPLSRARVCRYLHGAKVLYRSLAPELLMMSRAGYVQLMDYRMSKRLGGTQRSFTMIGTPDYLPPEQVRGQGHGLGADSWGLGVLLYELLAGEPPFGAGHSSELQMYAEVVAHTQGSLQCPADFRSVAVCFFCWSVARSIDCLHILVCFKLHRQKP